MQKKVLPVFLDQQKSLILIDSPEVAVRKMSGLVLRNTGFSKLLALLRLKLHSVRPIKQLFHLITFNSTIM